MRRWVIQEDVLTEDGNEIFDDFLMRRLEAEGTLYAPGIFTLEEMFGDDEAEDDAEDPAYGTG